MERGGRASGRWSEVERDGRSGGIGWEGVGSGEGYEVWGGEEWEVC